MNLKAWKAIYPKAPQPQQHKTAARTMIPAISYNADYERPSGPKKNDFARAAT